MKQLFTLLICLFYITIQAQQQKPVIRGGYGKTELSLGAGMTLPSSAMKNNTNIGNLKNLNLGVYVPILNYGGATGGVISLGFNAGGEYFTGNRDYDLSNYKPFNITGQTGTPPIIAKGAGSPKQAGFKTEGGAQANFSFGSYTISPILNVAYINLKQKTFTVRQSTPVNGQNYEHTLYNQAESKNSGVAVVAKLTHRYRFGKDWRFSIFAEANYLFGPSATTASTYFTPEGAVNAQGSYNLNQMNFGTQTSQTKSTKFNTFGVNAGIGIALGKNSESKTIRRRVEVLKSNKTGDPNASVTQSQDGKLTKADAGKTNAEVQKTSSQNCNCPAVNNYAVEYPSTGNNQTGNVSYNFSIPLSDLNNGKNIHFYFPNSPFREGNCYGQYKAVVNGIVTNTYTSGGTTVNQHIQIPTSSLVPGTNTITVQAVLNGSPNGATTCNLTTTTINVVNPQQSTATITLTPECCVVYTGPQHTAKYTGQVRYKMTGIASPGTKIKIIPASGPSVVIPFVVATGIGDGYTNCFTGSVSVVVLNALGNVMTNATVNGQAWSGTHHYKYIKSLKTCAVLEKQNIPKSTKDIKQL
ncbi:hypothetical protein [Pedobacter agri]|uniref:hypothetical protein n=1 Tax=Pedobacter agri TaxID=454586 RepID=UPI00292D19D2|nr:hypothetical protein [Pedobacter agri]